MGAHGNRLSVCLPALIKHVGAMEEQNELFMQIEDLSLKQALFGQYSSNRKMKGTSLISSIDRTTWACPMCVTSKTSFVSNRIYVDEQHAETVPPPRRLVQMILSSTACGFRSGRDNLRQRAQGAKEKLPLER